MPRSLYPFVEAFAAFRTNLFQKDFLLTWEHGEEELRAVLALAELLSMAALAAAQLLWGTVTVQLTVATLFQVAMLTLLGNIILLPLTYRFGYEKAKYVYYLCIGMLGGLMGITVSSGGILLNSILPAQGSLLVLVAVLAAVLALYAASWRLSVAWYGKAEQ